MNIDHFGIRNERPDRHNFECKSCDSNRTHNKRASAYSGEKMTGKMLMELKTLYRHSCAYCDHKSDVLHIDHVLPISKGGLHSRNNILPACPACNLTKSNKLPEEWFNKVGRRFEVDGNWLVHDDADYCDCGSECKSP